MRRHSAGKMKAGDHRNRDTYILLTLGIAVQAVTYAIAPDNVWALVSALFGVCSVVLCAQGKWLTFFFGFGQILTYTYLCVLERFYGGIAINVFYFASQIYGIYNWRKLIREESGEKEKRDVIPFRCMRPMVFVTLSVFLLVASLLTGWLLGRFTNDTQPYLDALTTVPAFAAQILLVMAYREQWFIWLFIDLLYTVMWWQAGSYCMVAQYVFWCVNATYGAVRWSLEGRYA
ncbi:MAG: nicotinamide riboside transporter PnuC [Paludibacteraceae bacterium]|nr:nicotinamide riboside transporter PnuC [Paludibacteraceae bacterium]